MKQSPFRMGWVLVMFDLPVVADAERKAATRFRNNLLDDGYQRRAAGAATRSTAFA